MRDGICCAPCGEDIRVICRQLLECSGAIFIDRDAVARGIVGVGPHLADQPRLEDGLLIRVEGGKVARSSPGRPGVEQNLRLAMQPVGAPIGSNVCAVAPDRANLLAADGLPDALAIGDGAPVKRSCPSVV